MVNYGYVTQTDTTSYKLSIESPVNGIFDLGVYYTSADQDKSNKVPARDLSEFTMTASKSFGPLDTSVAYIYFDLDSANVDAVTTVQAYLTYNF